jgi:hypothetical protein
VTDTPDAGAALAAATVTDAIVLEKPPLMLRGDAMSQAATDVPRLVGEAGMMGFWSAPVESSQVLETG